MGELLKYRIPGEAQITKIGRFVPVQKSDELVGFAVSDFLGELFFQFEESKDETYLLHFQNESPLVIRQQDYLNQAEALIESLVNAQLKKAVLSRVKHVDFDENKTISLFDELVKAYPLAFVYLISSEHFGTWIGASPEVLLTVNGEKAETMALAGTKKAEETSDWGQKEIAEQDYVTQFIVDELKSLKLKDLEVGKLQSVHAGPVQHLITKITFSIKPNQIQELLHRLHPTPAVSGLPQKEALELIAKTEKHQRLLYTGIIGFRTAEKSRFFVNLRCCQIQKGSAFLYLGGGFTKDSVPEMEWLETENKSKTLLNIIQNQ